ncbi:nucleolar essential protein-related [Striga hermonthica]|uniref:Nucleolar essential protein-related n=1 Tax=Striga hermonthica TaxID=68872 RepID=A0A9N7NEH1_STRHE|nr:nucleolar essential protein-related [Striga hermonthica]
MLFEKLEEENVDQEPPKKMKMEKADPERKAEQLEAAPAYELPGILIVPMDKNANKPELLSSDEHDNFLVKNKRNPANYRPNISFQVQV